MFQKICQIASLLSLFLTLSMLGGSYYAYRFVTSEQFKARVMNEVLDNVQGMMPEVLDNALPDMTETSLPIQSKKLEAEKILDEITRTILMIEGGIQFGQLALKKSESTNQPSGTVELGRSQGKTSSKSKA